MQTHILERTQIVWSSCLTRTEEKVLTEVQRITTKLFGDELAANNPKDTYKQSVTADYKIAADSDTETE